MTTKWVHVNKGTMNAPLCEHASLQDSTSKWGEDSRFAPTPPLERLRTVLSLAATRLPGDDGNIWNPSSNIRMQISLLDVNRAYVNARLGKDEKPVYVELPAGHPQAGRGYGGLFRRHKYGTLAAADGWQQEYAGTLRGLGFVQWGRAPLMFSTLDVGWWQACAATT